MGSTSMQLKQWAKAHTLQGKFLGVFSADTLPHPRDVTAPCCLIFNYDPASMPGSHWVAVMVLQDVIYFDSYGLAPDSADLVLNHRTHFRAWLTSVCRLLGVRDYSWNKADLQGLTSKTCGHWALYFCQKGPWQGWEQFGPNREANDQHIKHLVLLNE